MNVYSRHTVDRAVAIPTDGVELKGDLFLPDAPLGLVLFAHGAGGDRHSPRSRKISDVLTAGGVATLLFDLMTPLEAAEDRWKGHLSFDIPFLSRRLVAALEWAEGSSLTRDLGIGFFGASTGAAASLVVAAERPLDVQAVVSRGGRPDLAGDALAHVVAPTMFIVGEHDHPSMGWNQDAFKRLAGEHALKTVAGASHFFSEPGALEEVANATSEWFVKHLQRLRPSHPTAEGDGGESNAAMPR